MLAVLALAALLVRRQAADREGGSATASRDRRHALARDRLDQAPHARDARGARRAHPARDPRPQRQRPRHRHAPVPARRLVGSVGERAGPRRASRQRQRRRREEPADRRPDCDRRRPGRRPPGRPASRRRAAPREQRRGEHGRERRRRLQRRGVRQDDLRLRPRRRRLPRRRLLFTRVTEPMDADWVAVDVRELDGKRIRGAVAVPVEQRLEELRRHRPELDRAQSQAESRRGSRSSSEARVSSSSFSKRSEKSARTLATCVSRASSSFFVPSGVSTA